jgi:hypothetical protein
LLTNSNYPAVARFMNEMATLSARCDEMTRELFQAASLGEARRPVIKQLRFLLERFDASHLVSALDARFDEFIEGLRVAQSLHPAMPIRDAAVAQVCDLLETDEDTARKAITLFRFAWICRLRKEKDFSDFTLKSLVVVPQASDDECDTGKQTAAVLEHVFSALQATTGSCPALREFSRRFPDVRVRLTAYAMTLPAPLYSAFDRTETGEDRLDFLTKYQAGSGYLHRLIVSHSRRGSDATPSRLLNREWDGLYRRVVFLKTKTSKAGDLKHDHITPLDISPESLARAFAAVIDDPGDEPARRCGELLNKISKDDLVGNIRGLWAVKS